jgi:hypothetical protein
MTRSGVGPRPTMSPAETISSMPSASSSARTARSATRLPWMSERTAIRRTTIARGFLRLASPGQSQRSGRGFDRALSLHCWTEFLMGTSAVDSGRAHRGGWSLVRMTAQSRACSDDRAVPSIFVWRSGWRLVRVFARRSSQISGPGGRSGGSVFGWRNRRLTFVLPSFVMLSICIAV